MNETAGQILDAAEKAFADEGFAGARVAAIARAAGVNKAMLYYYFQSKEGLYRAVLERALDQLVAMVGEQLAPVGGEVDVPAFLDGYRTVLRAHPHLPRLVLRDVIDGQTHVIEVAGPRLARIMGGMGAALARGQREGRINPEIDPMLAVPVLVGPIVFQAVASPMLAAASGVDPTAFAGPLARTTESILLQGLLARPGDDR